MKAPKLPMIQVVLMVIFLVGTSILLAIPNLPPVAAGLDIAVWLVGYFGYLYLIIACLIYALKGN
jgi:hypothetical protein